MHGKQYPTLLDENCLLPLPQRKKKSALFNKHTHHSHQKWRCLPNPPILTPSIHTTAINYHKTADRDNHVTH
ncbi:hypothetical protein VTN49DRAFT_1273 [Thermomyces lanuginosus]|uniref:uncharacterized protein n=1 Tax=Thermomyces lanuginosus TaxID=5541 RepID=UPI003744395A